MDRSPDRRGHRTLRQLSIASAMVLVLACAVVLYAWRLAQQRAHSLSRMNYHKSQVEYWNDCLKDWSEAESTFEEIRASSRAPVGSEYSNNLVTYCRELNDLVKALREMLAYHLSQESKYKYAYEHPWLWAARDPPTPPDPFSSRTSMRWEWKEADPFKVIENRAAEVKKAVSGGPG